MSRVAATIACPLFLLTGCEIIGGFEDLTGNAGVGGAAGQGAVGGAAGGSSCEGQRLPGKKGAAPIGHLKRDGVCVYIDEREATEADYAQFVAEALPSAQALVCPLSVNPTFEPAADCPRSAPKGGEFPVVCIDQCDALAFCAWAGKSLCRESTTPSLGDTSAWFEACSNNGDQDYPYTGAHQPGACNDDTNKPAGAGGQLVPAGTQARCVTPSGVKDLSGNVAEWTDDCSSTVPGEGTCLVRGGAATDGPAATKCSSSVARERLSVDPRIGLRCCVYPP